MSEDPLAFTTLSIMYFTKYNFFEAFVSMNIHITTATQIGTRSEHSHSRSHKYSVSHSRELEFKQLDAVSVSNGGGLVGHKFTIGNVDCTSGNGRLASLEGGVHGITAGAGHSRIQQSNQVNHINQVIQYILMVVKQLMVLW